MRQNSIKFTLRIFFPIRLIYSWDQPKYSKKTFLCFCVLYIFSELHVVLKIITPIMSYITYMINSQSYKLKKNQYNTRFMLLSPIESVKYWSHVKIERKKLKTMPCSNLISILLTIVNLYVISSVFSIK